jgi:hypothetical protein
MLRATWGSLLVSISLIFLITPCLFAISDFQFTDLVPYLNALNSISELGAKFSMGRVAYLLIEKIREQGMLVDGFVVQEKDLRKISLPFLAYLNNKGWVIVRYISYDSPKKAILVDRSGKQETIDYEKFLTQWNGYTISKIITNAFLYKIPLEESTLGHAIKTVIVYLNHDRFTDRERIAELLSMLDKELSNASGERLIYVDELGLIPEKSVEEMVKIRGEGRQKVFQYLKNSFQQQLDEIQKGIPIYDPTIFYRELYRFLSQRKAKCFIENLDYKLWEFIVGFDSLKVFNTALFYFSLGNFQKAVQALQVYQDGYSTYNIVLRDNNFVSQLNELRKRFPNSIIFTVRGLAHYGLEQELVKKGKNVEILVLGNQNFLENFTFQQIYSLFQRNKVTIDKKEAAFLLLKTLPQEVLRVYFDSVCDDYNLLTKISIEVVQRLSLEDLAKLANHWKEYFVTEGYKNKDFLRFAQITYEWLSKEGFIKEEEKNIIYRKKSGAK